MKNNYNSFCLFFLNIESIIADTIKTKITEIDNRLLICRPKYPTIILNPMYIKTNPIAFLRYINLSMAFDKTKYIDLNPSIAKILELNAMNGSLVIAKTAGTESKANNKSAFSISSKVNPN